MRESGVGEAMEAVVVYDHLEWNKSSAPVILTSESRGAVTVSGFFILLFPGPLRFASGVQGYVHAGTRLGQREGLCGECYGGGETAGCTQASFRRESVCCGDCHLHPSVLAFKEGRERAFGIPLLSPRLRSTCVSNCADMGSGSRMGCPCG